MIWFIPTSEQETNRHTPYVTWTLVVLNVFAYIAMWLSSMTTKQWWLTYGLMPSDPHWWQYFTGNFVHAPDPLHLIGNMLFLVVFGDNVEDILGPLGFATLYFLGGLGGDVTFVHSKPDLAIPSGGASGCIATIAGAYAVMFWNRAVDVEVFFLAHSITTVAVPALLLLLFYFGMDLLLTAWGGGVLGPGGGVNYVAHGVGFALGLMTGFMAFGTGAVARFRKHREGHPLFGYLPLNIGPRRPRWRG